MCEPFACLNKVANIGPSIQETGTFMFMALDSRGDERRAGLFGRDRSTTGTKAQQPKARRPHSPDSEGAFLLRVMVFSVFAQDLEEVRARAG